MIISGIETAYSTDDSGGPSSLKVTIIEFLLRSSVRMIYGWPTLFSCLPCCKGTSLLVSLALYNLSLSLWFSRVVTQLSTLSFFLEPDFRSQSHSSFSNRNEVVVLEALLYLWKTLILSTSLNSMHFGGDTLRVIQNRSASTMKHYCLFMGIA